MPAYQVLDVAASLKVPDHFHGGGEYKRKSKAGRTTQSLEVVHRDTLLPANASLSYEQRLEEIVRRDAARVRGLDKQIESQRSSNKSAGSYGTVVAEFGGDAQSGLSLGSAEYLTRIGVGTPTTDQYMILNTGSDLTWIQCAPCQKCYSQADPIFDPSDSTSFSPVSCDSDTCSNLAQRGCQDGAYLYRYDYGDGSYTIGTMATEKLTFDTTDVSDITIGCGNYNTGLFEVSDGLLGLGLGPLSFPSQLGTQTSSTAFSYCLPERWSESSGTLQFGPESVPDGSFFTTMQTNSYIPTFYYLSLTAISIGGTFLESIPSNVFLIDEASGEGGVIIDSGTMFTQLQSAVYDAVKDAFVAGAQHLPRTNGPSIFDTCYDLLGQESVTIPSLGFHFSNEESLYLPGNNYLTQVSNNVPTLCFSLLPTDSKLSITENVQQQHIGVSFDSTNSLIGFAQD